MRVGGVNGVAPFLFLACVQEACSFTFPDVNCRMLQFSRRLHTLYSTSSKDDEAFKKKMAMVRAIQKSFYSSGSSESETSISDTGLITNLPLWRAPWSELPGRTNVLIVYETLYTNMFETILNGERPFYFGHLLLEGGSKSLKNPDVRLRLKNWEGEIAFSEKGDRPSGSAVVGTLHRIVDYRRMSDGNLLLLVQALERFVVDKPVRELPYSIADVQLLPDWEETFPGSGCVDGRSESEVSDLRSQAIAESFRYHEYEYDETVRLPVPDKENLSKSDVYGPSLVKVIPLIPLSKSVDPAEFMAKTNISPEVATGDRRDNEDKPLEARLEEGRIMRIQSSHPEVRDLSEATADELEVQLWICINQFVHVTGQPIRQELLALLPRNRQWPEIFSLDETAASLESSDPSFVRVSEDYPTYRRQKRLSFAVSTLLEKVGVKDLRQILLETPSTHARLSAIVERIEIESTDLAGEFM